MKFRKKPVVIEAWKIDSNDREMPLWVFADNKVQWRDGGGTKLEIETLEGIMVGNKGDYLIKGVAGELYPCKPDIFEMTYEPVEDSE
jgi:hypothetical protein